MLHCVTLLFIFTDFHALYAVKVVTN